VRADDQLRRTRIVVTSGSGFNTDQMASLDAGADDFLGKPIDFGKLSQILGVGATKFFKAWSDHGPQSSEAPAWLRFWGVRGSVPTPGPATVRYGGNTSCVELRADGQIIIFDAGTGLRPLGAQLIKEFGEEPLNLTLLLTHTHWDHIQGLPFFTPLYRANCRLRILGFEGARSGLVKVVSSQMESPFFPVPFGELPGNVQIEELKDLRFDLGTIRAQAWFANHPGICVGYRLFTPHGSVAYFPDNEPRYRHDGVASARPVTGGMEDFSRSQERKTIDFLRGTDVLILDSQYDQQEYESRVGWGHGCVDDAVAVAAEAEVKRLVLFHHDPDHDDATIDGMVKHARQLIAERGCDLEVTAAREGVVVELGKPVAAEA